MTFKIVSRNTLLPNTYEVLNRVEKLANALTKISVKSEHEDEETPASEHHTFKLSCYGTCRLQAF